SRGECAREAAVADRRGRRSRSVVACSVVQVLRTVAYERTYRAGVDGTLRILAAVVAEDVEVLVDMTLEAQEPVIITDRLQRLVGPERDVRELRRAVTAGSLATHRLNCDLSMGADIRADAAEDATTRCSVLLVILVIGEGRSRCRSSPGHRIVVVAHPAAKSAELEVELRQIVRRLDDQVRSRVVRVRSDVARRSRHRRHAG